MSMAEWLPELVLLVDYRNNWENYLSALYTFYTGDFIENKPVFRGGKLAVKKHPLTDGKECTFWHIIQEGGNEDERIPDLRRCERIRWPKPIIEHCEESRIRIWENKRHTRKGKQISVCMWLEQMEYLIILRKRAGYFLFWTSYPVTASHRKNKLRKEYQAHINKQGAS